MFPNGLMDLDTSIKSGLNTSTVLVSCYFVTLAMRSLYLPCALPKRHTARVGAAEY